MTEQKRETGRLMKELLKGIWAENPIFRLVLGMCPTLAVTTSLENGLGMGVAATFVLVCSNAVIAAVRNIIPSKVRIPCFIVVIATFVTIVDLLMNAFTPDLHKSLGLFIPLIVVNCIILGRAEAFASKNSIVMSIADGVGMGLGFTLGLAVLAAVREVLGAGTLTVWGDLQWQLVAPDKSLILMILAPGGFIALGLLLALMNHVQTVLAARDGKTYTPPQHLDCRHCTLCKMWD
jgi:electron transport complex protein RnfE